MLLIVWRPHSNQRYWVFVYQKVTQAENLYPAKRIEVRQSRLVVAVGWGGGHYDTQHFETYSLDLHIKTGFSLKASNRETEFRVKAADVWNSS